MVNIDHIMDLVDDYAEAVDQLEMDVEAAEIQYEASDRVVQLNAEDYRIIATERLIGG